MIVPTANDVDLKGGWDTLVKAFEAAAGADALLNVLAVAGTTVVVIALLSALAANRRAGNGPNPFGGHNAGRVTAAVIFGIVMTAPKVVAPGLLWFLDLIANAAVQVLRSSGVSV